LLDTPGLLDTINYENEVINQLWRSRIIVYVTSGQLYQQELDFLEKIYRNYLTSHKVILFVNKQDIAENTMPTSQRNREKQAIVQQVSHLISSGNIAFGSASPKQNGRELPSQINELDNLIYKFL
jgi:GTPase Era involved in 16S rRNA processing